MLMGRKTLSRTLGEVSTAGARREGQEQKKVTTKYSQTPLRRTPNMVILDELAQTRDTVVHSCISLLAFSSALDPVITQVIKTYFFFF
jgi:hypothetical protein